MTRQRTLRLIAIACAAAAMLAAAAMATVLSNVGTAQASERVALDASERPYEPPEEVDPIEAPEVPEEGETPLTEDESTECGDFQGAYDYEEPVYDYAEPTYDYEPVVYDYAQPDGLTREGGINYHDGRTETYYSSSALYHHRTGEWTADEEGFYRDAEGRYVVAASDMEQGTVFEGSKGECVVLDTGCADGTTDYYVNWI